MNLGLETEIYLIDSDIDGIEQVTEVLRNRCNVQSLQLIGFQNGNDDNLQLGLSQLNIYTLDVYSSDLYQWQNALSATSEILLRGCLVAGESNLYNFLQQLAAITGADIGVLVTVPDYFYN